MFWFMFTILTRYTKIVNVVNIITAKHQLVSMDIVKNIFKLPYSANKMYLL